MLHKTVASKFSFQPQEQNDLPRVTQISLCHLLFYTRVEGYSRPQASALFLDKHRLMGLLRIRISYYFPNKSPFHIFLELASLQYYSWQPLYYWGSFFLPKFFLILNKIRALEPCTESLRSISLPLGQISLFQLFLIYQHSIKFNHPLASPLNSQTQQYFLILFQSTK